MCSQTPLAEPRLPLKLKWRRGKDMPFGMRGYPNVVVFKGKAYIGGGIPSPKSDARTVVIYHPEHDSYESLPPYTHSYFSIAVIIDQLVLVGGCNVHDYAEKTNKLAVWHEKSKRWTHPLPPMTTACDSPSVAIHNNRWLVVIGGHGSHGDLSRVEILDTLLSLQWYLATSLPHPCHKASSATIGNMCYVVGGFNKEFGPSKKVFSVCLDDLISLAVSPPTAPTLSPWQSLPDTPLNQTTALAFKGILLTVGGRDCSVSGTTVINVYQTSSNSWVKAGSLTTKRHTSGCTVLPSGEVLVAGGDGDEETRQKIEIASIL